MLDGSMSVCAEANGVKVGDVTNSASLAITNNFNVPAVDSAKPSLIAKVISSVRGALDPAGCAREFAEARRVKAGSDIEVYDLYRQNMPWLSERQAFLYANGFVTTPTQADNVFAVFEAAESKVADSDEASALPAPVVESVVDGAKGAYDDEARELWASVLAGEMERPGSVSKRTMSILGDMGRAEAESFSFLCSQCLGGRLGNGCYVEPIPLLLESVGARRVEQIEIDALNALGLTDVHTQGVVVGSMYPFGEHGVLVAPIGGVDYRIERGRDTPQLALSKFTGYGVELSSCCEVGNAPGFREAAISWLEETGAKVMRIVKWNDDGSYDYEYDDEK